MVSTRYESIMVTPTVKTAPVILNQSQALYNKTLSLTMIRKLSKLLNMPAERLLKEYELKVSS